MFKKILILTLFLYFTTVNANFSTSHSKTIDDNDEIHITHSSYIYDVSSMPERVKNNDYDVANPDSKFISYNEFYFGGFTSDEKLRTIIHEFGHALGLFEFNKFNSDGTTIPESKLTVMRQGVRSFPLSPSTCDIDVLTYIWGE